MKVNIFGYVVEKKKGHPMANRSGYVVAHRRIWFDHYGPIQKGYVIHHRDLNKRNNHISNLECLTNKDHLTLHNKMNPAKLIILKCAMCGKEFSKKKFIYDKNRKRKSGIHERVFCGRSCWATCVNYEHWAVKKSRLKESK